MSSLPPPPPAPPADDPVIDPDGPVENDDRRWGLGDMWLGLVTALVAVVVIGIAILAIGGYDDMDEAPGWLFFVANSPLHFGLAAIAIWAVTTKGRGVVRDLGWQFKRSDIGVGLVSGVLAQFILVPLLTLPVVWLTNTDTEKVREPAEDLADRAINAPGVVALVLTTAVLAPVVEELFFRGLVFGSYRKRRNLPWLATMLPERWRPDVDSGKWNLWVGAVLSSAIFSIIHPSPILWPALFGVGMVFAWLVQKYGRLGPAIWSHAAFNGTTVIVLLALD